ncbi:MAG: FAD-dependent oxidoreductase [Pseudomonadota bacterium]
MESLAADLNNMTRTPLHDSHVAALREAGDERSLAKGELIVDVGQTMDEFFYVLEGELEIVNPFTGGRLLPHGLGPTQFAGEIAFLRGGVHTLGIRAAEPTRVLAVPRDRMLELMAATPEMSDIIITVFAARRRRMLEEGNSSLTLVGPDANRNMRDIAAFAYRNRIPFKAVELNSEDAHCEAERCEISANRPAVIFGKDEVVEDPSPRAIAKLLGLDQSQVENTRVDVLIVGGGPSGVAAGVYAGAEGLSALVVDELAVGGQAGTSSRIENYLGFPTGISGADLVWRGEVQALKFGTRFAIPNRVVSLRPDGKGFKAELDDGACVYAGAVVVATGVQYRRLPLDRLTELEGMGVYYAATESEARFCGGTEAYVIGGGNSAGQAAMYLGRNADHVHVLVRGQSLAASMSDYLSSRLERDPCITVHYGNEVTALHGDEQLDALEIRDKATGKVRLVPSRALFVMVGAAPNTGWLSDLVTLDDKGFVLTGRDAGKDFPYATSCPGVYAVGDVRAGSVKRVASSVGEGSVVISDVWRHLNAT